MCMGLGFVPGPVFFLRADLPPPQTYRIVEVMPTPAFCFSAGLHRSHRNQATSRTTCTRVRRSRPAIQTPAALPHADGSRRGYMGARVCTTANALAGTGLGSGNGRYRETPVDSVAVPAELAGVVFGSGRVPCAIRCRGALNPYPFGKGAAASPPSELLRSPSPPQGERFHGLPANGRSLKASI